MIFNFCHVSREREKEREAKTESHAQTALLYVAGGRGGPRGS